MFRKIDESEKKSCWTMVLILAAFIFVFFIVLGAPIFDCIPRYDANLINLALFNHFEDAPTLTPVNYSFGWFGGGVIAPTFGHFSYQFWAQKLGFPVWASINFNYLTIYFFLIYFLVRSGTELTEILEKSNFVKGLIDSSNKISADCVQVPWKMGVFFISLFLTAHPLFQWRLFHGHSNIVAVMVVHAAIINLLFSNFKMEGGSLSEINRVDWLMYLMAAINLFAFNAGYIFYVFLLVSIPFYLCFSKNILKNKILWLIPITGIVAILCQYDLVSTFLKYIISDGPARTLSSKNLVHSYYTGEWRDWLSFLSLSKDFLPTDKNQFLYHEIHYPVGLSIILSIGTLFALKKRGLVIGIITFFSILIAMIVSCNMEPISTYFIEIIPAFKSFRVPQRMMIPLAMNLIILSTPWILFGLNSLYYIKTKERLSLFIIVSLLLLFLLPFSDHVFGFEITAFLAISIWIFLSLVKRNRSESTFKASKIISSLFAILFISIPLISAKQIFNYENKVGEGLTIRNQLKMAIPKSNALERYAVFDRQLGGLFLQNAAASLGVNGIEGYWPPIKQQAELWSLLEGSFKNPEDLDTTRIVYPIFSEAMLAQLSKFYSISKVFRTSQSGQEIKILSNDFPLSPTEDMQKGKVAPIIHRQPILAIEKPIFLNSSSDILKEIIRNQNALPDLSKNGPVEEKFKNILDNHCQMAAEKQIEGWKLSQQNPYTLFLERQNGTSETQCLVLRTNYSSLIEVLDLQNNRIQTVKTFRSHGLLLGLLIPPGITQLKLSGLLQLSWFDYLIKGLGLTFVALLLLQMSLIRKKEI